MTHFTPRSILKAAIMSSAILGFANTAAAEDIFESDIAYIENLAPITAPRISASSKIAIARLDGGRLIPAPYSELEDWSFLNKRTHTELIPLSAASYIKYTPEIAFNGQDTDNKIDEVRLTAANEGMAFTLIYAVGTDADFALFGHRTIEETGISLTPSSADWSRAKARALLMESHSGKVLGMVTSNNVEFNIGELADRTGDMIKNLSVVKVASRTTISG